MRAPADSSGPNVMHPRIIRGLGELWAEVNNMLFGGFDGSLDVSELRL